MASFYDDNAARHADTISSEMAAAMRDPRSARRTKVVHARMSRTPPTNFGREIDWDAELSTFRHIDYPDYYLKPFHSVAGGWLSQRAATKNRQAMNAIYADSHPRSCTGLRDDLATFVPGDARVVVDLGAGDGDGPAATARRLPGAVVCAVEASPYMIVCGQRQNVDVSNLRWHHALAERTGLPRGSADAVTITLVLHECADDAKRAILAEAFRILRPGGTIVLADTPQDDLGTFRGFYEPYKQEWLRFDPRAALRAAGFKAVSDKVLLGDVKTLTAEEHRAADLTSDKTHNRLFVFTARKKQGKKKVAARL